MYQVYNLIVNGEHYKAYLLPLSAVAEKLKQERLGNTAIIDETRG